MLTIPNFTTHFPELLIGQTTRAGGVSTFPYATFNLGRHTHDDPERVEENYRRLADYLGVTVPSIVGGYQVHGSDVAIVSEMAEPATGGETDPYTGCDAFITNRPGLVLSVSVADCIPVLVYDPKSGVVAAIHAGWRGTVAGIVGRTLISMAAEYGSEPADCWAYVGTGISERHFEVSRDVAERFPEHLRSAPYGADKFLVDLKQSNAEQLGNAGLPDSHIEISPFCTVADNDRFFSYRKEEGTTGRMLGIIGMK